MKKFILKCILLVLVTYGIVISINLTADPANISGDGMVEEMTGRLLAGEAVVSPGNFNEGLMFKLLLEKKEPGTVIIGSSSVLYIPWEFEDYQVIGLSGAYLWDDLAAVGLLDANGRLPERIVISMDPWLLREDQGVGRHDSISEYGRFEAALISGMPREEALKLLDEKKTYDSWKEYFSFSYFQSSIEYIGKWGWAYVLSSDAEKIRSATPEDYDSLPCILPDGRHTNIAHDPVVKMDGDVNWMIESGHLDSLGEEFALLSPENAELFEGLIKLLSEEGVIVELYLPAIYPVLYDHIKNNPAYEGVELSEARIREVAAAYGVTVHGSYDPNPIGITGENFSDWNHINPENGLKEYRYIQDLS